MYYWLFLATRYSWQLQAIMYSWLILANLDSCLLAELDSWLFLAGKWKTLRPFFPLLGGKWDALRPCTPLSGIHLEIAMTGMHLQIAAMFEQRNDCAPQKMCRCCRACERVLSRARLLYLVIWLRRGGVAFRKLADFWPWCGVAQFLVNLLCWGGVIVLAKPLIDGNPFWVL